MERVIYEYVFNHLQRNKLIYEYQSGFLQKYSKVHELLEQSHVQSSSWLDIYIVEEI
jgi:hypothetical protein